MHLMINGQARDLAGTPTITDVLAQMGHARGTVSVAINETFVPRSLYDEATLDEGDRVDIVAPQQGG